MIKYNDLKDYIISPTLNMLRMKSDVSVELLCGTCAVESNMGDYIYQLGNGPAIGIYQMEPATYESIIKDFLHYRKPLYDLVLKASFINEFPDPRAMAVNHFLATAMCRIRYYWVPEALPANSDIEALATYWKKHYNTEAGKGTTDKFIEKYNKYCKD